MSTSNDSTSIGFIGTLQLIFITLKLCNVIDWSWWWVLFPLLGATILFILAIILIALGSIKS
jgi:hypothetical protein